MFGIKLRRDEHGATMVEYSLIIALMSLALIAVLAALKVQIFTTFWTVGDEIRTGGSGFEH